MKKRLLVSVALLSAIGWALPASAEMERQVIQMGKEATALVVLPSERGFGSAFCIDPRGLFITNAHVVEDLAEREAVTLVLHSGEAGQRILRARVLARDDESDLAMLATGRTEGLTALALGDSDELFEAMRVTAFGYPFGGLLTVKEGDYPSVTVNVARISAIRRADGEPQFIQLDSQLNPGNSGGPVIDAEGNVVGIVVAGVAGAGINFAIPVGTLRTLLEEPRIVFNPPEIAFDDRNEAVEVAIHFISFASDQPRPLVTVVLGEDEAQQRTFHARHTGGGNYEARIVPSAPEHGLADVPVTIEYEGGSMRTIVPDRAFRLDDRRFRLSEISRIERIEREFVVVNKGGLETRGRRLTMAPLVITLAGQQVEINPQTLGRLLIHEPEADTGGIAYTIRAEVAGSVIAESAGTIEFTGLPELADEGGEAGDAPVAGAVPTLRPPPAGAGPLLGLEEVARYEAPGNLVQMVVSDREARLFVRNAGSRLWVIDLNNGQVISEHAPTIAFSDMSLTPDGRFLFASDFGGERVRQGEDEPVHHVHRYTASTNRWETRRVSSVAFKIVALAPTRFLLHSQDQWLTLTLNQWDARGVGVTELDRAGWGRGGGLTYDSRTNRVIHGNSGSSSREVMAMTVQGNQLVPAESSGTYGAAQDGGGTYVLSADGRNFFYGRLMFGALDMTRSVRTFPEPIIAAGTHLAFDQKGAYYEIRTGAKMGELPFEADVFAWSSDGRQMWCFNPSDQTIRRFHLTPERR